jgi:hypothetical protein
VIRESKSVVPLDTFLSQFAAPTLAAQVDFLSVRGGHRNRIDLKIAQVRVAGTRPSDRYRSSCDNLIIGANVAEARLRVSASLLDGLVEHTANRVVPSTYLAIGRNALLACGARLTPFEAR